MTDLRSALNQRADRGEWRGSEEIFLRSKRESENNTRSGPRRVRILAATTATLCIAAIGIGILRQDSATERIRLTGLGAGDGSAAGIRLDREAAGLGDTVIVDVASAHGGLIAIGAPADPHKGPVPVGVWISQTGERWAAVKRNHLPSDATRLEAIVQHPDGNMWVVGSVQTGSAVWRSQNGNSWIRVDGATLEEVGFVSGLVVSDADLVAYGVTDDGGGGMWMSPDGHEWKLLRTPGPVVSLAERRGLLVSLILGPGEEERTGRVFISADRGATWTLAALLGPTADPATETLTCNATECWAATRPRNSDASTIWHSIDGVIWTVISNSVAEGALVDTLTSVDGYIVATGVEFDRPAAWISSGGARWKPLPLGAPPGGRLNVVVRRNATLVALGSAPELGSLFILSWT